MIRVERGNVVLHVKDEEAQYYLSLGYNVTDECGTILQRSIPTNIGELQKYYIEHLQRISELEAQVASLTAAKASKKTKATTQESES